MPHKLSEAALAKRRQRAIDRGFMIPRPKGHRFVAIRDDLHSAMYHIHRSLRLHRQHDLATECEHHFARQATLRAMQQGVISEGAARDGFSAHRAGNRHKHEISKEPSTDSCAVEGQDNPNTSFRGIRLPKTRAKQLAPEALDEAAQFARDASPYVPLAERPDDVKSFMDLYVFLDSLLSPFAPAGHAGFLVTMPSSPAHAHGYVPPAEGSYQSHSVGAVSVHAVSVSPVIGAARELPGSDGHLTETDGHTSENPEATADSVAAVPADDRADSNSDRHMDPSQAGDIASPSESSPPSTPTRKRKSNLVARFSPNKLHLDSNDMPFDIDQNRVPAEEKDAAPSPRADINDTSIARPPTSTSCVSADDTATARATGSINPSLGDIMRIGGLTGRPDLNGILCRLERWDGSAGRWQVSLHRPDSQANQGVKIRPANLQPTAVPIFGERPGMVRHFMVRLNKTLRQRTCRGLGPLPISDLDFGVQWLASMPFSTVRSLLETDGVTLVDILRSFPEEYELLDEDGQTLIKLLADVTTRSE